MYLAIARSMAVLGVACWWTACDDKEERAVQTLDEGSAKPAAPKTKKPGEVVATENAISDAQVKALLDRWVKAQNDGDFEAYQAIYADKFLGIKRAGERTSKFARDGWLKDRAKMFKAPMKVEVRDMQVRSVSETAVVTFTQYWSSKSFEDVGPKQLVLVKDDDALRIAREEMLRSEIRKDDGKFKDTGLHFVFSGMVAFEHGGSPAGALQPFGGSAAFNVRRPASDAKVPKSLTTFDVEGKSCEAKVDGSWFAVQVDPHFAQVQHWDGELEASKSLSDRQKHAEVWQMGRPIAALSIKGCPDARWAVSSEAKDQHRAFKQLAFDASISSAVGKEFQKAAEYAQVQKRYADAGGNGAWTSGPPERAVRVYALGDMKIAVASAKADQPAGEECGGYLPTMFAIFDVSTGTPQLLGAQSDGQRKVVAVLDLHNDGKIEVLTQSPWASELWRAQAGELISMQSLTTRQDFDCGC